MASLIQNVYLSSLKEAVTAITEHKIPLTATYYAGASSFPIDPNSQALQDMMTTIKSVHSQSTRIGSSDFLNSLSRKMLKLPTRMSITESLQLAKELTAELPHFYGMLLVQGKKILNVLHPLALLPILEQEELVRTKYQVVIYTYESTDPDINLQAAFNALVQNSLKSYQSSVESTSIVDSALLVSASIDATGNVQIRNKRYPARPKAASTIRRIVPVSILANHIAAPHYGAILIQQSSTHDRPTGTNLYPQFSANVSQSNDFSLSNICTGSTPSNTVEGLHTLNHANLASPLNREIVTNQAPAFAAACIRASLNLFDIHQKGLQNDL